MDYFACWDGIWLEVIMVWQPENDPATRGFPYVTIGGDSLSNYGLESENITVNKIKIRFIAGLNSPGNIYQIDCECTDDNFEKAYYAFDLQMFLPPPPHCEPGVEAELIAQGFTIVSGPYTSPEACENGCQ
jgi:hypothetical protein